MPICAELIVITDRYSVSGYVSQSSIQSAIITQIVKLIRSGKFSSVPSKVVLVGHSFGSVISNAVLNSDPDLVDGAVLTGMAYAGYPITVAWEAFQTRLARLQNSTKWEKYDGGYITWADLYSNIEKYALVTFWHYPFTREVG